MMLHKIFHMNQSVAEARRRLSDVSGYRHHLDGVEQADTAADGTSEWRLRLPLGFSAEFTLAEMSTDEPNTVVFKSVGGDLNILGMVSFHAIKKDLTEIDLVINYESGSVLFNLLDKMLNAGDHFLVHQLRRVRAHFEGIAAPVHRTVDIYGHEFNTAAV